MDDQNPEKPNTQSHRFSLETRNPDFTYKQDHRVLVIALFRVSLWLSPGPLFLLFGILLNMQSLVPKTAPWIMLSVISTVALGYFDACLSENIKKENGIPKTAEAVEHSAFFLFIQFFLGPLSCILLAIIVLTVGLLSSLL